MMQNAETPKSLTVKTGRPLSYSEALPTPTGLSVPTLRQEYCASYPEYDKKPLLLYNSDQLPPRVLKIDHPAQSATKPTLTPCTAAKILKIRARKYSTTLYNHRECYTCNTMITTTTHPSGSDARGYARQLSSRNAYHGCTVNELYCRGNDFGRGIDANAMGMHINILCTGFSDHKNN